MECLRKLSAGIMKASPKKRINFLKYPARIALYFCYVDQAKRKAPFAGSLSFCKPL